MIANNTTSWRSTGAPSKGGGASTLLRTIGDVEIYQRGDVVYWTSGLAIDADGSPRAYHPNSALGLDRLANAGHSGDWWALATDTGADDGLPVIQGHYDPAPGFYVSTTALQDFTHAQTDPLRYVDAEAIPYIVLPADFGGTLRIGDFAVVVNLANGKKAGAICADIGDANEIGEGSIALANALGIPSDPRTGGASGNILVTVFTDSRTTPAWPHTITEINAHVAGLVTQHHLNLPNLPTT